MSMLARQCACRLVFSKFSGAICAPESGPQKNISTPKRSSTKCASATSPSIWSPRRRHKVQGHSAERDTGNHEKLSRKGPPVAQSGEQHERGEGERRQANIGHTPPAARYP